MGIVQNGPMHGGNDSGSSNRIVSPVTDYPFKWCALLVTNAASVTYLTVLDGWLYETITRLFVLDDSLSVVAMI